MNFLVPFDRDPFFIGRETIMSQLYERLKVGSRISLAGIGGIGYVMSRILARPQNAKSFLNS